MIHTHQLTYTYPNASALRFPDVQLPQGGVLVLSGDSGSGKSTWLALLAGLLAPLSGSVVVAGQSLGGLSNTAKDAWRARNLGFLPQKLHLSEALTVAGNLSLAYFAAGLPEDAAATAHILKTLDALSVADLAHRKPSQLSGGQAQRVALARAVLLNPRIILADEPTASLDDTTAESALRLLQSCAQRSHATLVIATHDQRVADGISGAEILQFAGKDGTLPTHSFNDWL